MSKRCFAFYFLSDFVYICLIALLAVIWDRNSFNIWTNIVASCYASLAYALETLVEIDCFQPSPYSTVFDGITSRRGINWRICTSSSRDRENILTIIYSQLKCLSIVYRYILQLLFLLSIFFPIYYYWRIQLQCFFDL